MQIAVFGVQRWLKVIDVLASVSEKSHLPNDLRLRACVHPAKTDRSTAARSAML